jgi:hypothetical protein
MDGQETVRCWQWRMAVDRSGGGCALNAEHDAIAAFDAHRDPLQERASRSATGVQNGADGTMTRDTSPQESSANPTVH